MPTNSKVLLSQHQRAVRATVDVVRHVRAEHLDLPTPCAQWNLRALVEHMIVQHHGFAAAAEGSGSEPGVWEQRPVGTDPAGEYAAAVEAVLAAFAKDGVTERLFALPEITTETEIPATLAIGFHLVDYVVHGWDVAAALGVPFELDADVADAALEIAKQVPDDEQRHVDGAAFGPAIEEPAEATLLERTLLLLGRSPDWSA